MQNLFKMPVGVHLLLTRDNSLLMLLRAGSGYGSGYWSIVAGKLDGDESGTAAMIREAREEAGIVIVATDLELACVMHRKTLDRETIEFFYSCRNWTGEIKNMEPGKCSELRFVPLEEIPVETIDYIRAGVGAAVGGEKYIEFGWKEFVEPKPCRF